MAQDIETRLPTRKEIKEGRGEARESGRMLAKTTKAALLRLKGVAQQSLGKLTGKERLKVAGRVNVDDATRIREEAEAKEKVQKALDEMQKVVEEEGGKIEKNAA